jgi:hypothetical protein
MSRRPAPATILALLLSSCVTPAAQGTACTRASECAAPLACRFGRCRAACEANRDCPAGASCLLGSDGVGSCGVEVDLGCESGVGRTCAEGLLCVADRCTQSCGSSLACAEGSVCTDAGGGVSFCAPGSEVDAGTSDASDASDALDASTEALLEGAVLVLHMDETSWSGVAGEVVDSSGLGNAGRAIGAATVLTDAVRGQVGHFEPGGCILVPDAASLRASDALTMSAWIHPVGIDDSAAFGIVSKRTDFAVDDAYDMYVWTGNRVFVDIDGANDRFSAPTTIVNTTWVNVTVTFDGALPMATRVRVYVGGVLSDVRAESSATIPPRTADLAIGCLPASLPAQSFRGELDEVVLWTRALSDAEVAAWAAR